MRSLVFEGDSWKVFKELCEQDKKLCSALCRVLKEMVCDDPSMGMGRPISLIHDLSGFCSRRISQKDRVIYKYDGESIFIFAIGGWEEKISFSSA